jgi:hypothetical protein
LFFSYVFPLLKIKKELAMLVSTEYFNYVSNTIRLVDSFIVKSNYTAKAINTVLQLNNEVIPVERTSWKYYLNLAGIAYVGQNNYNSDPTDMVVYSLDLDEMIPFNTQSLVNNPETLSDLRTLGDTYKNILLKYPNDDILIRGIIDPIPLDVSIEAADYQILHYNRLLLNYNETNVIPKVQGYIDRFIYRFDNVNYGLTDHLYPAAIIGILFVTLPMEIVNIRLENCKTPYVNEWHVWNYLSGYFDLSKHKGVIPYGQALFLYRNIEYIIANSGTTKILDFLNDGFAKPFNLDLSAFTVRKNFITAHKHLKSGKLTDLVGDVGVYKFPYGENVLESGRVTQLTPGDFVNLLASTGVDNKKVIELDTLALINGSNSSVSNDILTGVIEGNVANNVALDLVNKTLEHVNNWFYLTSIDYIKFKISIDLVDVGITNLLLTAKDAAVLYLYANAQLSLSDTVNIPEFWVKDIMVKPNYPESTIRGLLEAKFQYGDNFDVYSTINKFQTVAKKAYSLSEFSNYMDGVISNKFLHLIVVSQESDYIARSEALSLIWSFYNDVKCTFCAETKYSDFLNRIRLNSSKWTDFTYRELIVQISNKFMAIEIETATLQSPYSNMLDILSQICSYTVTFVAGEATNYNTPLPANLPDSRVSYVDIRNTTTIDDSIDVMPKNTRVEGTSNLLDSGIIYTIKSTGAQYNTSVESFISLNSKFNGHHKSYIVGNGPQITTLTE